MSKKFKYISASSNDDKNSKDNEVLNEEINSPENVDNENNNKKQGLSGKRIVYFWLGIFTTIMTVIGIIFTVGFVGDVIKNLADNTSQKEDFAKVIYPFVIVDCPDFNDGTTLLPELTLRIAAWDTIINYDEKKYADEFGNFSVPESDLEVVATRLLGEGLTFEHQHLGDASLYFNYDSNTKSYSLPVMPTEMSYYPKVEEFKKNDDKISYTLKVGYYSPLPEWVSKEKKDLPFKYRSYTLEKSGKEYIVKSIKTIQDSSITNDGI